MMIQSNKSRYKQALYDRPSISLYCMKLSVPLLICSTLIFIFAIFCNISQGGSYANNVKLDCGLVTTGRKSDTTVQSTLEKEVFDDDPNPNAPYPRVAWLMSYPNSGTSFTMQLVYEGSEMYIASNYGSEEGNNLPNLPLYSSSPNGPYILHRNETQPKKYILTKTHCGGRCVKCPPQMYMETQSFFMSRCAQGHRKSGELLNEKEIVEYDPLLVQRAIHLIRNPFDNIVSNFHLERKKKVQDSSTNWLDRYPNDVNGFRKWCSDKDMEYPEKEQQLLPKDVVEIFQQQNIPCHAHFYKYAKWHDYTIEVRKKLKLPSIIVFYEDYEQNFSETATKIFEFLQVPQTKNTPSFVKGKTYSNFFTENEQKAALHLVRLIVGNETWDLLKIYSR